MDQQVRRERGATAVSYIILVGVVALGSLGAFQAFGSKVADKTKAQGGEVAMIAGPGGGPAGPNGPVLLHSKMMSAPPPPPLLKPYSPPAQAPQLKPIEAPYAPGYR